MIWAVDVQRNRNGKEDSEKEQLPEKRESWHCLTLIVCLWPLALETVLNIGTKVNKAPPAANLANVTKGGHLWIFKLGQHSTLS